MTNGDVEDVSKSLQTSSRLGTATRVPSSIAGASCTALTKALAEHKHLNLQLVDLLSNPLYQMSSMCVLTSRQSRSRFLAIPV